MMMKIYLCYKSCIHDGINKEKVKDGDRMIQKFDVKKCLRLIPSLNDSIVKLSKNDSATYWDWADSIQDIEIEMIFRGISRIDGSYIIEIDRTIIDRDLKINKILK